LDFDRDGFSLPPARIAIILCFGTFPVGAIPTKKMSSAVSGFHAPAGKET
jgi:hypothetical protein